MSEEIIELLECFKRKEERLKKDSKHWQDFNRREREIWLDGWAACEIEMGLEKLESSVN